jgi:maleate cis-trans isomerase
MIRAGTSSCTALTIGRVADPATREAAMSMRKRIGLMVPSTNTTCEADFQMVVPRGITVHGQRLWMTNEGTGDEIFNRMNAEIESGARYLATAKVDAIVYGCTTGSFFKGPGWDRAMCDVIQGAAGVPAVATSPSVIEALRVFGARRISVATPYPDWNNRKLRAYLEAHGFEVLNVEGEPRAAASGNQGINDQGPESVVDFASRACRPDADALLCSCTAWRSVEAVAALEARTGKPVVTSNQSTIWASLRVLGVTQPITGFGRLLERLAVAPTAA